MFVKPQNEMANPLNENLLWQAVESPVIEAVRAAMETKTQEYLIIDDGSIDTSYYLMSRAEYYKENETDEIGEDVKGTIELTESDAAHFNRTFSDWIDWQITIRGKLEG